MSKKLTHEEFLEKLKEKNEHYRNGEFEVISEYRNISEPLFLKNKYAICRLSPIRLYEGNNISIKSAMDKNVYIIAQFKEIHGDMYDYSKFEYKGYNSKSIIVCEHHGEFLSTSYAHLHNKSGCSKCSNIQSALIRTKTTEQFIKDSISIHGDRYNYNLVNYVNAHKKVEIICKIHGAFQQKPNAHLSGKNGCMRCNEWKDFKIKWLNTKNNYGILYICKFFNDFESFIKIGITTTSIKKRYSGKKYNSLGYEIIEEIKIQDKNTIWLLEEQLKSILKDKKYTPLIKFEGYSECYKIENFKEIYGEFKKITRNYFTKKI